MQELRKNIITREWVIIAKGREKRPEDFCKIHDKEPKSKEETIKNCPFCPGNEKMIDGEILVIKDINPGNYAGWSIKVVENKYPALLNNIEFKKSSEGIYYTFAGAGNHEVIIEGPDHFTDIPFMPPEQVKNLISVYYQRYSALMAEKQLKHIVIFRNHGPSAGTSLLHPHSQLIATPVMPKEVFLDSEGSELYYEYEEACPYCKIIEFEDQSGDRKVCENDSFITINPFFSRFPYETWILPRRHNASFGQINLKETEDLSKILQETLLRLYNCLKDPSYNLTLHSLMVPEWQSKSYHWHFQIIPRLTTPAGFELGTGMYINTTTPEDAAKFLAEAR